MTDAVRAQYPPIEEYAFLSDGHTSALVGLDGGVEWMCVPRFDGPSVFARMLDRTRGGAFTVDVAGASLPERRYLDGSLVLESRFVAPDATVMILDFLALAEEGPHGRGEVDPHHVLVRIVRCERGTARIRTTIDARPDYARSTAQWRSSAGMFSAAAPGTRLWATSDRTLAVDGNGALSADFDLAAGEAAAFSLRYLGDPVQRIGPSAAQRLLETTLGSWRTWSSRCAYQGPLLELVERSAVVLKGLVYHHSGAVLAAPTTSLPESIGGERNWDYRFTWLRDASLTLMALFRLGYDHEGRDYMAFLLRTCSHCGRDLQLMLGIGGELDLPEETLDHLDGYRGSRPVRVGNAAHEQVQLDTFGGVLDAALVFQQMTGELSEEYWPLLQTMVDATCERWREPDNGIWEVRGAPRHFTHSKVMSWVTVDRGLRLAEMLGVDDAPLELWRSERDAIHADVLEHGWDVERDTFAQAYGDAALDASLLRLPLVGFLPGDDPRIVSTIDAIIEELSVGDGLLLRYRPDETDDGLAGEEGAFAICSFWLVSALALAGRGDEARRRLDALAGRASALGLYAEEFDAEGGMLGNFPQAFTHLALVQAAFNVSSVDDREALRAWAVRDISAIAKHVGRAS